MKNTVIVLKVAKEAPARAAKARGVEGPAAVKGARRVTATVAVSNKDPVEEPTFSFL
jgi:hypothetical protein